MTGFEPEFWYLTCFFVGAIFGVLIERSGSVR